MAAGVLRVGARARSRVASEAGMAARLGGGRAHGNAEAGVLPAQLQPCRARRLQALLGPSHKPPVQRLLGG